VKNSGVLNKDLAEVIAGMGHLDLLVVGDAGLPIPAQTRRIDLAVSEGVPGFIETIRAIAEDLCVESMILAHETGESSPQVQEQLIEIFPEKPVRIVSHEELKQLSGSALAVVRTGEFTPYANVVLVGGVVF
jgi:D-ribose pyranase